ncbi:siderophore ABC transporter substrate-binding protein [Cellulosimicrobium cellulans]|uniref:siderophore ABC transporter substrate-binding protein n=1 Tax=Cellulosimicrobium cellulans TaxID=1710 RepID=UPI000AF0B75D|nr:siderophore ABC transporter substrate-binding protein [Cellulosimicrobium cellulans]
MNIPRALGASRTVRATAALAGVLLVASACASTGSADAADGAATEAAADDAPATVVVEHAQGETEVDVDPQKVFTYDFAALSVLDALGVEVAGVPKQNVPEAFSQYADDEDVQDIGTLFEPDYELVAAEQPDLIIVAGRSSEAYPQLSEIAPTIDLSNDWTSFQDSVVANAETLAPVFGAEDEVDGLVEDLDAAVADVQDKAESAGTALVVLTSGGEVTAYGPGSRFGFLHDSLGLTPAVEDVEAATHGEAVSFEFLLETDPDWLFVVDRDAATGEGTQNAEQVLDNEVVHRTTAWQQDQVVYLDPTTWYIINGGVPTLTAMAEEVGAALDGAA